MASNLSEDEQMLYILGSLNSGGAKEAGFGFFSSERVLIIRTKTVPCILQVPDILKIYLVTTC